MAVNGSTKLGDLLREHPYLVEYLVQRSPVFRKLENPLLRKAMGQVATLAQVAAKAGIAEEVLTGEIIARIGERAGRA